MGNLAPAIMPNAYIFICTEAGGKWSAKQTNDEKALSAEVEGGREALEVELTKVVKEACGGSAFTVNHSQITPTTTVFAATIGGVSMGGGAPASSGGAAAPASGDSKAEPEPEPEPESEPEEEDMDFDLFD